MPDADEPESQHFRIRREAGGLLSRLRGLWPARLALPAGMGDRLAGLREQAVDNYRT